ncbi:MAG TPA: hypothetical protein VM677_17640 [Actinokineospora sp.]|nr:hypothetical protein [Actinokineospora sp.]
MADVRHGPRDDKYLISAMLDLDAVDESDFSELLLRWMRGFPKLVGENTSPASVGFGFVERRDGAIEAGELDMPALVNWIGTLPRALASFRTSGDTDTAGWSIGSSWSAGLGLSLWGIVTSDSQADESDIVEFLDSMISDTDPAFGCVSTRFAMQEDTELDYAMGRRYDESLACSREYLRGYSWITLVPNELVHRLGGAKTIKNAGFHRVVPHFSGAAIIVAAPTGEEYPDSVPGLFRTLAPVLPPGKPKQVYGYDLTLEWLDASDFGAV